MINILLEGRPIYNHDNHKTVILASLYFFSVEELMPSAQWTTLYSNVMTRYVDSTYFFSYTVTLVTTGYWGGGSKASLKMIILPFLKTF